MFLLALLGLKSCNNFFSLRARIALGFQADDDVMPRAVHHHVDRPSAVTVQLTGKSNEAADAQRKLAQAFGDLKLTTQKDLTDAANNAKGNLETIRQAFLAGNATIEDVKRAFDAYAAKVKTSVADSTAAVQQQAQAQVDAEASAFGLQTVLVAAGAAGKKAGDDTAQSFDGAKGSIDHAKDSADEFGDAAKKAHDTAASAANGSGAAFGAVIALTAQQTAAMNQLNEALSRGVTYQTLDLSSARFILEQIGPLIGAGAQILQQRLNDLSAAAEKAQQVADQMANEANDLQDQIDQLEGNDTGIEDRRHAQKLADLKAEAEANGTAGTAAYNQLVQLEDKLHTLKLQNIKKEQQASGSGVNSSDAGGGFTTRPNESQSNGAQTQTQNTPSPAPSPQPPAPSHTLNTSVNVVLLSGDAAARKQLAALLVRDIDSGLKQLAGNRF